MELRAILQCKYVYHGKIANFDALEKADLHNVRKIFASLIYSGVSKKGDGSIEFMDREKIIEMVVKHSARLPLAQTLRIGQAL